MAETSEVLTVTPKDAFELAKSHSDLNALIAFCKRRWADLNGGSICTYPYLPVDKCEMLGILNSFEGYETATVAYFLDRFFNEWEENKNNRAEIARLKEQIANTFPKTVLGQTILEGK